MPFAIALFLQGDTAGVVAPVLLMLFLLVIGILRPDSPPRNSAAKRWQPRTPAYHQLLETGTYDVDLPIACSEWRAAHPAHAPHAPRASERMPDACRCEIDRGTVPQRPVRRASHRMLVTWRIGAELRVERAHGHTLVARAREERALFAVHGTDTSCWAARYDHRLPALPRARRVVRRTDAGTIER